MFRPLAAALLATLVAVPVAGAQEYAPPPPPLPPPSIPDVAAPQPQCTTTTTTTTTCTGTAAPLAVPVAPGPIVQPPDVPIPIYPAPAYAWPPQPYPYPYPMNLPPPPPPRRARVELQPRYGLVIGGLSMFASVYLWNAAFAYMTREGTLAVPVVGPLLLMSDLNNRHNESCCYHDDAADRLLNTILVVDSLVQATGATLFLVGMLTREKVTVWEKGNVKMTIVPTAGMGGGGVGMVGVF